MGIRENCPSLVFVGADLTEDLVDDYRPYMKEAGLRGLEDIVRELVGERGPVTRIEWFGFRDGSDGYHTKWYWFGDPYDLDCPDMELTNAMAGVDRFSERRGNAVVDGREVDRTGQEPEGFLLYTERSIRK